MATLLLADHDNKTLAPSTGKALTAAREIGGEVDIFVAGQGCRAVAEQAATLDGVRKVLIADAPQLAQLLAEEIAALIVPLMATYDALLAPATPMGKNVLPRVAALLDVAQVSDIIAVKAPDTFERPVYAGNAIETGKTTDKKIVATARSSAFAAASEGGWAPIEAITPPAALGLSSFETSAISQSERPELTAARIVMSGGRGMTHGADLHNTVPQR